MKLPDRFDAGEDLQDEIYDAPLWLWAVMVLVPVVVLGAVLELAWWLS